MRFRFWTATKAALVSAAFILGTASHSLAKVALLVPAECPAEHAVYELKSPEAEPGEAWKLSFIPASATASIASDLYLQLETPQRTYWFTFNVAQGYGGISIWPVSDPYAEPGPRELIAGDDADALMDEVSGYLRFMSFDENLVVANDPPAQGDVSPRHILLPEIGLGLWYSASAFTEDEKADRDPMPRGMFTRSGCLVVPAKKALPVHVE